MECIICLEDIKYNCKLKCNHNYHYTCILNWNLCHSEVCPYCRTKIRYTNKLLIFFLIIYKILLILYIICKILFCLLLLMISLYYIHDNIYLYAISSIVHFILFTYNFVIFVSFLILFYICFKLFQLALDLGNSDFQNMLENIVYNVI